MKTKQENFMSMARAVDRIIRKHQTVWHDLPRFTDYAARITELLREVDAKQVHTDILSTGATIDKAAASEHAIHIGNNLSRRAIAYAEERGLYQLRNQLKIRRHELLQGHDAEILHKLQDLLAQLQPILPQLPDYGVTQQQYDELADAINKYDALLVQPREIIVERKSQNETLSQYVKVLRQLLNSTDHLINNFEGTLFEEEYHNARIVINLGTRHLPPAEKNDGLPLQA